MKPANIEQGREDLSGVCGGRHQRRRRADQLLVDRLQPLAVLGQRVLGRDQRPVVGQAGFECDPSLGWQQRGPHPGVQVVHNLAILRQAGDPPDRFDLQLRVESREIDPVGWHELFEGIIHRMGSPIIVPVTGRRGPKTAGDHFAKPLSADPGPGNQEPRAEAGKFDPVAGKIRRDLGQIPPHQRPSDQARFKKDHAKSLGHAGRENRVAGRQHFKIRQPGCGRRAKVHGQSPPLGHMAKEFETSLLQRILRSQRDDDRGKVLAQCRPKDGFANILPPDAADGIDQEMAVRGNAQLGGQLGASRVAIGQFTRREDRVGQPMQAIGSHPRRRQELFVACRQNRVMHPTGLRIKGGWEAKGCVPQASREARVIGRPEIFRKIVNLEQLTIPVLRQGNQRPRQRQIFAQGMVVHVEHGVGRGKTSLVECLAQIGCELPGTVWGATTFVVIQPLHNDLFQAQPPRLVVGQVPAIRATTVEHGDELGSVGLGQGEERAQLVQYDLRHAAPIEMMVKNRELHGDSVHDGG